MDLVELHLFVLAVALFQRTKARSVELGDDRFEIEELSQIEVVGEGELEVEGGSQPD
jgi:hypothetical protein